MLLTERDQIVADPGRRLTETAASSGVSRTRTDVLRATSARARRRPRNTPVGTESLLRGTGAAGRWTGS
jgi:hypothetical protein